MKFSFVILSFALGLSSVRGTGEELKCYQCIGYDKNEPADHIFNTESCLESKFDGSKLNTTDHSWNPGDAYVCGTLYLNTPSLPTEGHILYLRGKIGVLKNSTQPSSLIRQMLEPHQLSESTRLADDPPQWMDPNGELLITWCSSDLCNGVGSLRSSALLAALLCLAAYFL